MTAGQLGELRIIHCIKGCENQREIELHLFSNTSEVSCGAVAYVCYANEAKDRGQIATGKHGIYTEVGIARSYLNRSGEWNYSAWMLKEFQPNYLLGGLHFGNLLH